MKYLVTWRERPTGSAAEYEAPHKRVLSVFAAFSFTVEPVMDVMDAVAAENRGIAWRDSLSTT